jgi:thioredoxin 1
LPEQDVFIEVAAPMQSIFNVNFGDFEAQVLQASMQRAVLVDFWADWCSPCLVIAPVLEKVIADYEGQVLLAKLEVDEGENMKLAGHYRVRGFPTIILFYKGKELGRFSGAKNKNFIEKFVDELVQSYDAGELEV